MHDVAIGCRWVVVRQTLGHRLARARHHVAMQQSSVEQMLQYDGHAADTVDVGHVVLTTRLGVGNVRHLGCDPIEVIQ